MLFPFYVTADCFPLVWSHYDTLAIFPLSYTVLLQSKWLEAVSRSKAGPEWWNLIGHHWCPPYPKRLPTDTKWPQRDSKRPQRDAKWPQRDAKMTINRDKTTTKWCKTTTKRHKTFFSVWGSCFDVGGVGTFTCVSKDSLSHNLGLSHGCRLFDVINSICLLKFFPIRIFKVVNLLHWINTVMINNVQFIIGLLHGFEFEVWHIFTNFPNVPPSVKLCPSLGGTIQKSPNPPCSRCYKSTTTKEMCCNYKL